LRKYGQLLQALAHAVLLTLGNDSPCNYHFPLNDDDKLSAVKLTDLIVDGSNLDCVNAFHVFIAPFLSGRDFAAGYDHSDYSKWQEVLECFLAIYCLTEDGNFKPPHDVTAIFAKIEYLCRGTTLYDGLSHVTEFQNNPYK
jgi:hypothetical protein